MSALGVVTALIALIAMGIALVAWVGAMIAWFVAAYHILTGGIRWFQSKPAISRIMANLIWFRHGVAGLRDGWDSMPPLVAYHRQKSIKALLAFVGFGAIFMLACGIFAMFWNLMPIGNR